MSLKAQGERGLRGKAGRLLGHDILGAIFGLLDTVDLCAVELTCHQWQGAVERCKLWRCHALYAWDAHLPLAVASSSNEADNYTRYAPTPAEFMAPPEAGTSWRRKFLAVARWRRTFCSTGWLPSDDPLWIWNGPVHRPHSRSLLEHPEGDRPDTGSGNAYDENSSPLTMKSALGKKVDYNNYHVSEQWQRPQATFMLQGRPIPWLEGPQESLMAAAQDGILALREDPQVVRLWDIHSCSLKHTILVPEGTEAAAFAAPGQLVTQGAGHTVLWRNGRFAHRFPLSSVVENGPQWTLLSILDGTVAECSRHIGKGAVRMLDLYSGKLSRILRPAQPNDVLAAIQLAEGGLGAAGGILASMSGFSSVQLTAAASGQRLLGGTIPKSSWGSQSPHAGTCTIDYDEATNRLFYSAGFMTAPNFFGTFDMRMPTCPVWQCSDSHEMLVLPPWGCRDVGLLMPISYGSYGPQQSSAVAPSVGAVDLATGAVIWNFRLGQCQPLSSDVCEKAALDASWQRQRAQARQSRRPQPKFGTAAGRQQSRPAAEICNQPCAALLSGHIVTPCSPRIVVWSLPTWQQLLGTSICH